MHFTGDNLWQALNLILVRRELPDETLAAELGRQWDALCEAGREHVEKTDLAVVQTITITLKVKTYKTDGDEMANEIASKIKGVIPSVPLPTKRVFMDPENVCHTTSQQKDDPAQLALRVVPGVGNDDTAKAGKPAVKVV